MKRPNGKIFGFGAKFTVQLVIGESLPFWINTLFFYWPIKLGNTQQFIIILEQFTSEDLLKLNECNWNGLEKSCVSLCWWYQRTLCNWNFSSFIKCMAFFFLAKILITIHKLLWTRTDSVSFEWSDVKQVRSIKMQWTLKSNVHICNRKLRSIELTKSNSIRSPFNKFGCPMIENRLYLICMVLSVIMIQSKTT